MKFYITPIVSKSKRLMKTWMKNVWKRYVELVRKNSWIKTWMTSIWERCTEFVRKKRWLVALVVISIIAAYPFIGLGINRFWGWNWGTLYTFGMSLEDFITRWIAFWVFVGAGLNVLFLQRRVSIMEKQYETQQKQLLVTRFSESVELLGHSNQSARIGGAYSLYYLAREHEDYRETICEILCAHVRTVTSDDEYKKKYKERLSNEIQTILNLLFKKQICRQFIDDFEKFHRETFPFETTVRNAIRKQQGDLLFDGFEKNLRETFLCGANLMDATLSDVNFSEAILSNANFSNATLSNVDFFITTFHNVSFSNAIFNGQCIFKQAELSDTHFDEAKLGVTYFDNIKFKNVHFDKATLSNACFMSSVLIDVSFSEAILKHGVMFHDTTLIKVGFSNAQLDEKNYLNGGIFNGTVLEDYTYEEITRPGHSLELTTPQEEQDSAAAET